MTLYLHIGSHKTGSTSLQRWLNSQRSWLLDNGRHYYRGLHFPNNHIECYLATMRPNRDSFARQAIKAFPADYYSQVKQRLAAFAAEQPGLDKVISTEGLSLLRFEDELVLLNDLLAAVSCEIKIVLYLRDKAQYLASYRAQLAKKPGRRPSKDYWSALYVEDDTWLTDYDALIAAYTAAFGPEAITIIDYDAQMQQQGDIIPSFIHWLGLDASDELRDSMQAFQLNRTLSAG
ncbi:hypothetical protein [Alkalimonas amylolytica]|uniref:Sulfotransferase family protein n=1 Tax=Alkalimonas amylolytica TaxID=152573 RepID=A0A1H4A0G8_ALKAM|nr:hypothetical protein [Alkalimonas amylolytica]SEA29400.1 hypothetical protein SAMN04488051_102441 [Alkalimonas amylolytica]